MEFIEKNGVTIENSVVVSGVTNTDKDEEIVDCLKHYGLIKNSLFVTDQTSPFYKNLIVEYNNSEALVAIAPLLPYTYQSTQYSALAFTVKSLAKEYSTTAGVVDPAEYINQLKHMARRSGKNFENILKELMGQISGELTVLEEEVEDVDSKDTVLCEDAPSLSGQQGVALTQDSTVADQVDAPSLVTNAPPGKLGSQPRFLLSQRDLNPHEVQKVVVEHIVKTNDVTSLNMPAFRLRPFSGKTPKPTNEAENETWRSHIELLLADPTLAPLHITRRILESLLSPAV